MGERPPWDLSGPEAVEASDALCTPARMLMKFPRDYEDAADEYYRRASWSLVSGDLWAAIRAAKIAVHIDQRRAQHVTSRAAARAHLTAIAAVQNGATSAPSRRRRSSSPR